MGKSGCYKLGHFAYEKDVNYWPGMFSVILVFVEFLLSVKSSIAFMVTLVMLEGLGVLVAQLQVLEKHLAVQSHIAVIQAVLILCPAAIFVRTLGRIRRIAHSMHVRTMLHKRLFRVIMSHRIAFTALEKLFIDVVLMLFFQRHKHYNNNDSRVYRASSLCL